jgi:hypothetical protein
MLGCNNEVGFMDKYCSPLHKRISDHCYTGETLSQYWVRKAEMLKKRRQKTLKNA